MSPPDPPSDPGAPQTLAANGDLANTRGEDVLRFCERVRFSGTLGFQAPEGRGILPLLCGVPEIASGDAKLEAALDEFLALDHGTYALTQLLPPLAGATADGDLKLRGTLETQTPADLLRYCEGAGLTGSLTLQRDEKSYVARYVRGELQSVTVDDEADADLARVFAWDRGRYEIAARSLFERERKATSPDAPLLQTLEIALAQILDQSLRGAALIRPNSEPPAKPSILRGATQPFGVERSPGAPLRPATVPPARHRSIAPPPPPPSTETTVKVYLVDKGKPRGASEPQPATAKLGSEVVPLDPEPQKLDATVAEKPAEPEPSVPSPTPVESPSEPAPKASAPAVAAVGSGPRVSLAWTAAFATIVVASGAAAIYVLVDLVR